MSFRLVHRVFMFYVFFFFSFSLYVHHVDLHLLTHSFPSRRSSDRRSSGPAPPPRLRPGVPLRRALRGALRRVRQRPERWSARERRTAAADRKSTRLNSSH